MADFGNSLLKISNSPILQQFLHDCIDDLIGAKPVNFDSYNSDIEWTLDDFNGAKKNFQKLAREAIINDDLEIKENLPDNVKSEIRKCLEIRNGDILNTLIKDKLRKNGHNVVENVDWRLKWVLGNSKLATLREPLLQVDLNCEKNEAECDNVKNCVNFEMNLEAVDALIEQLQKVTKEVDK